MATDNFNRANESPIASPWGAWGSLATCRLVSNALQNSSGSDGDAGCLKTDSNAHDSQFVYVSGTKDGGPAIHCATGPDGYFLTAYDDKIHIFSLSDGIFNQIGSDILQTYTAGQTVRLRRSSGNLITSLNGSDIDTRADSTFTTTGNDGAFVYAGNLVLDTWTNNVSSGQTVEIGLVTETDSALAFTKLKNKAIGLNTETDSALSATMAHAEEIGLVTETDTAFSLGKRKTKAIGLVSETDSALSVMVVGDGPSSYFTDFPDTENPINQDDMFRVGDFTEFYKNPRSTPGKCFAADFVGSGVFDDCLAHLINHTVPVDHRVTATVFRAPSYTAGETHEIGLYVRMLIGVGGEFVRGYEVIFEASASSIQVVRWDGTSHDLDNFELGISVTGGSFGSIEDGDEIAVEVIGDDFEVFHNGDSIATFTDSQWSDGNPGMGFFVREGGTTPENFCISSWSAAAAGTIVTPIGINTETDSAFTFTRQKNKAIGLNTETDSALALARTKNKAIGLNTETDSALAVGASQTQTVAIGLASETDSPLAMTHSRSFAAGLNSTTDTALAFGKRKNKAVGLNSETDTALSVRSVRPVSAGLCTETDSAFSFGKRKNRSIGQASEVDLAFALLSGQSSSGSGGAGKRLRLGIGLG